MPCYDPYTDPRSGSWPVRQNEIPHFVTERLNTATRLLCKVLTEFDKAEIEITDPELRAWWEEHKEHDRQRTV